MKVVETFDRAHNLREVKLVYSTLAESFGEIRTGKKEIKEIKGSASKVVASTKSPKQEVISEGHEMRERFKKLAGIL
jgi:CRISPR/Cas system-associated protein Cas10 (large subunit of type III CRISPR-Cas system)